MTQYSKTQKFLIFLFLWFSIGASLGTFTLLGPVAYITKILRESNSAEYIEKITVNATIMLLIIFTSAASIFFSHVYFESENRHKFKIWLIVCLVLFSAPMCMFFNPSLMKPFMPGETKVYNFVFGPYPEYDELKRIGGENYTAVISLLHPAVLPFEPELLKREEENCAKLGVKLIKAPMLPWLSKNIDSLKIIEQIAKEKTGKYYIHCYLGRDRVHMAKNVIEKYNSSSLTAAINEQRKIDSIKSFERGDIFKFTGEIYLTPYPTDEEFISYILNGNFKSIVSFLDEDDKEDKNLIEKEKEMVRMTSVELINISISSACEDRSFYSAAVEKIKKAQKPVLVHAFNTSSRRSQLMKEELSKLK